MTKSGLPKLARNSSFVTQEICASRSGKKAQAGIKRMVVTKKTKR
jgi:hypothetical protein